MIALLFALDLAHAGCDAASLQSAIDRAEQSFVEMEADGFASAANDAETTLDCMTDALSPIQAAGYHRLRALDAFLRDDHANATLYFQAVRGTQPGYELPETIAPIGHPLRDDFEKSKEFADSGRFDLPTPDQGWLNVDGQRSATAPGGRPFVLQWFDASGDVKLSAWVPVGSKLPEYPVAPPTPVPGPAPLAPEKKGVSPLTIAGIGVGVVGLGLYGAAFATHGAYDNAVADGDQTKIESTHSTTNALTIGSIVLLGGGAGLVIGGVL